MSTQDETRGWQGRTMVGSDGEKIGKVSEIYEDPATGRAEWATVSSGLFGNKSNFVPLTGACSDGEEIRARVTKAEVRDAPGVADDDELTEQEERRLFEHYGVAYAGGEAAGRPGPAHEDPGATAAPGANDETSRGADRPPVGGASTDTQPVGSEQGARSDGDQPAAGGRRRLCRYVVTEITTTVPVSDEETEIDGGPTDSTR